MANWRGLATVFGGFLIHFTMGTFFTVSNMNTYITSYIRKRSDPDLTYSTGIWLPAIFLVGEGLTISVGYWIQSKIGTPWTAWIGSAIFSFFMALNYFAINFSYVLVIFSYAFIPALGFGIAITILSSNSCKWFPKRKGLVVGITVSGFGIGAVAFNQIQTYYINPDNKSPEDDGGEYFTDDKILNRLPSLFLVLGAIYFVLQAIGCLLVFEADNYIKSDSSQDIEIEKSEESDCVIVLKRPLDALKMKLFYAMWMMFGLGGVITNFINALYKPFGLTFIADDHLLAIVASLSSFANCLGRVIWGPLLDRYGSKVTIILMNGMLSILIFTFYLTKFMGSVLYTIWVCLIFVNTTGIYTLFIAANFQKFGTKHGTVVYSFVFTGQVVGSLITTPLLQIALDKLGWFLSWLIVGLMALFCTAVSLFWFD